MNDHGAKLFPSLSHFFSKLVGITLIGVYLGGFGGCDNSGGGVTDKLDAQRIDAVEAKTKRAKVYDMGVVEKDVVFDCVIGGLEKRTVDRVTKSCGCATVGLEEGDVLDFSKPFKVSVSMKGKPAGKGSQDVTIGFKDGTVFLAKVKYDYRPLPSITPKFLVFQASDKERVVTIDFPDEEDISITKIAIPHGITSSWNARPSANKSKIVIKLQVDRSLLSETRDGVIDIVTSSDRRASFSIPFLILDN